MTILQDKIHEFGIPVVETHSPVTDPRAFIDYVRTLEGVEGFVVGWDDGHKIKVKTELYVLLHKTKDAMSLEKNVVEILVNEKGDDMKAFMDPNALERFNKFEVQFWDGVKATAEKLISLRDLANFMPEVTDRKTYAVKFVQTVEPKYSRFLYAMFEPIFEWEVFGMVTDAIAKATGTQAKVDEARWLWGGANWNVEKVEEE